jgi:hypothetical protein
MVKHVSLFDISNRFSIGEVCYSICAVTIMICNSLAIPMIVLFALYRAVGEMLGELGTVPSPALRGQEVALCTLLAVPIAQ